METPPEDNHTHDESSEATSDTTVSEQPPELPESLLRYFPSLPEDLKRGLYRLTTLETVWMYYQKRNSDQDLTGIFKELEKLLNQSFPGGNKVLFSPAGTGPAVVYSHIKGETSGADRQLLRKVNRSKKLFVETKNWQECDIIFLFCPVSSRLGADVEAAMDEVSVYGDKKIILVLMYHTHKDNCSTSGYNWSDVFPKIKLQVPVLFHHSAGGLLDCEKNTTAVRQIEDAFTRKRSAEKGTDMESKQRCEIQ